MTFQLELWLKARKTSRPAPPATLAMLLKHRDAGGTKTKE